MFRIVVYEVIETTKTGPGRWQVIAQRVEEGTTMDVYGNPENQLNTTREEIKIYEQILPELELTKVIAAANASKV